MEIEEQKGEKGEEEGRLTREVKQRPMVACNRETSSTLEKHVGKRERGKTQLGTEQRKRANFDGKTVRAAPGQHTRPQRGD